MVETLLRLRGHHLFMIAAMFRKGIENYFNEMREYGEYTGSTINKMALLGKTLLDNPKTSFIISRSGELDSICDLCDNAQEGFCNAYKSDQEINKIINKASILDDDLSLSSLGKEWDVGRKKTIAELVKRTKKMF